MDAAPIPVEPEAVFTVPGQQSLTPAPEMAEIDQERRQRAREVTFARARQAGFALADAAAIANNDLDLVDVTRSGIFAPIEAGVVAGLRKAVRQ